MKTLLPVLLLLCLCACGEPDSAVSAGPELTPEPTFDLADYENPVKLAKTAKVNDDFIYDVYVDHIAITSCRKASGTLEIPTEIDGVPVTVLSGTYQSGMTSISLPEGLLAIGEFAFVNCAALTEVQLPNSLKYLNLAAFYDCGALETLTLPAGLETLDIPYQSEACLPEIQIAEGSTHFACADGVLFDAEMETLLYCPKNRTGTYTVPDSVKTIGPEAFGGCALTEILLPDSLREIEYSAFLHCDALETITLPKQLESLGSGALGDNARLTEIQISPENPNYVSMDGVLYNKDLTDLICYPMAKPEESYTVPDGVKTGWQFPLFNPYLKSLTVPASAQRETFFYNGTAKDIYYDGSAQQWLHLSMQLDATPKPTVHIMEDMREDIWSWDGDYAYTVSEGQAVIQAYMGKDASVTVPETLSGHPVTAIGDGAFRFLGSAQEITLPEGLLTIGDRAFYGSSIVRLSIPSTVETIGSEALAFCCDLAEITVAEGSVRFTALEGALYTADMTGLIYLPPLRPSADDARYAKDSYRTSYILPTSVTDIAPGAFLDCTQLDAIGVEAGNPAFAGADGVLTTADGKTMVAYPAASMYRLVPNTVTSIGPWAFAHTRMGNYTSHFLQDVTQLGTGAFAWSMLSDAVIPQQVTVIPEDAFLGSSISSISIPAGVTEIGRNAFSDCSDLTTVYFGGTQAQWDKISISSGNEALEQADIQFETDKP